MAREPKPEPWRATVGFYAQVLGPRKRCARRCLTACSSGRAPLAEPAQGPNTTSSVHTSACMIAPAFVVAFWQWRARRSHRRGKIVAPRNSYSGRGEDGYRGVGAEVRKELPMPNDDRVNEWVEDSPRRRPRDPRRRFWCTPSSATPTLSIRKEPTLRLGGLMYLNRGMIEAAKSEGEVAGVMARDPARRAAPRHGPGDEGSGRAILGTLGQIGGAIDGVRPSVIPSAGSQIGAGLKLMCRSSRIGIAGRPAGRFRPARLRPAWEMANMFLTIVESAA